MAISAVIPFCVDVPAATVNGIFRRVCMASFFPSHLRMRVFIFVPSSAACPLWRRPEIGIPHSFCFFYNVTYRLYYFFFIMFCFLHPSNSFIFFLYTFFLYPAASSYVYNAIIFFLSFWF